MNKLALLVVAGGCLLSLSSRAIDLKQAKLTQVINKVDIISVSDRSLHQAAINDDFKLPDVLRTGPNSRAELVAADKTITRAGASTVFSYDQANRTIDLQEGSLLFHSPTGKVGGTIHTGSATASVIGTTIIVTCTPNGGFKLLDLEGRAEVRFLNGLRQHLEPGQMTFILPGGTQPSPIIIFRLDDQTKGSLLVNGFGQPLPSMAKIDTEITRQLLEMLNNQAGDTGLLVGNNATPDSVQVFRDFQAENAQLHALALQNNNNPGGGSGNVSITAGVDGIVNIYDPGIGVGIGAVGGGDVGISGNNGDVDIESSYIWAYDSINILAPGGSVTLNDDTITAVNNLSISSGGDMTVDNSVIGATGGGNDLGSISISSGGTLTVTGQDGNTDLGYDIGADGSVTLSGATGVSISDALIKTLDGDSGNTITISSDGNIGLQTVELDSDGLISLSAGGDDDIYSSILNAASGDVDISSGGNIEIGSTTVLAGDSVSILAPNGSVTVNNDSVGGVNNVDVVAGAGLDVGDSSINADSNVGTISLANDSDVTTINNGSSMQAFYISVNSPDGILLDGTGGTFAGNQLNLASGNAAGTDEIDVQNADLTAFQSVNISAHTVNLLNVGFGDGSLVNLQSFYGLLADNPDTGATSVPGYVNFINGVTYAGTLITSGNQSTYVNPSSGPGIYISTLGSTPITLSAGLSAHTVNLPNTTFGAGSSVNLGTSSNPNVGGGSVPGYVNFNNGVNYGGNPAPRQIPTPSSPGGGPGIHVH